MSLKRLTRVKCIPPKDIEALQQHGVYTSKVNIINTRSSMNNYNSFLSPSQDFLSTSPLELMTVLGYSYSQLQALIITISKASAPHSKNVKQHFSFVIIKTCVCMQACFTLHSLPV